MPKKIKLIKSLIIILVFSGLSFPIISFSQTKNLIIDKNTVLDQDIRGSVEISVNNITLDCNGHRITGNYSGYGIYLNNKTGVNIKNCLVDQFSYGIRLHSSSNNNITNNTLSKNSFGIYLYSSANNVVEKNFPSDNTYGIYLDNSSGNTINNNQSSKNWYGIRLENSSNNNDVSNNTVISNSQMGIDFVFSSNNNLANNAFLSNGFFVLDSYQNTVKDNTVNGRPLIYLEGQSGYKAPENAGQVILVNSSNITVENQDLSDASIGLELWATNNSQIANNKFLNNLYGIYLYSSSENKILSNAASTNGYGIALDFKSSSNEILSNNLSWNSVGLRLEHFSNNNILKNNIVSGNSLYGLLIADYSSDNTIVINTVSNNGAGIRFERGQTTSNSIYLNNFINNTDNNVYSSQSHNNNWNSPEKISYTYKERTFTDYLGNYWSDYAGSDTNNDGIGDIPYWNLDSYPLIQLFENYKISLGGPVPPELPPEIPPPVITKWCEREQKDIPKNEWTEERCSLPLTTKTTEGLQGIIQKTKEFVQSPTGSQITKTVSTTGLVIGGASIASGFLFFPTSFAEGFLLLLRLVGAVMTAFGLKKRVRPWGTVYDSVTKQPLDPAYVVLKDLNGKEIASSITDLDGRYGFLIGPGKYQMIAQKTNYKFPSQKLFGRTHDELYADLYFGQAIEIKEVGEVITKNIPLDPEKFDWNEFAKKKKNLLKFYSQFDLFLRRLSNLLFIFGFFASIVAVIFVPYPYNLIILILYLFLLLLRLLGLKPKTYGLILEKQTGFPLSFAILRVFSFELEKEMFQRVADKFGRYYILVPKGIYYLKIEKKNEDGSYSEIFTSGIINAQKGIIQERFIV